MRYGTIIICVSLPLSQAFADLVYPVEVGCYECHTLHW